MQIFTSFENIYLTGKYKLIWAMKYIYLTSDFNVILNELEVLKSYKIHGGDFDSKWTSTKFCLIFLIFWGKRVHEGF